MGAYFLEDLMFKKIEARIQQSLHYFSKVECALWSVSMTLILVSFLLFDKENYITLIASIIGVTSLIFNAKGNPIGQFLMIVFSVFYGIISYSFAYYGEMITYLGMSAPMALFAFITWLKNPYDKSKVEVKVNRLKGKEILFMFLLTGIITILFFFILKMFQTSNLMFSTLSVTTSFLAVYLTFRRSPYFAVAYAMNDIVLIILWYMASLSDASYLSVVVCFLMFLLNDLYGFMNWMKIQKRQQMNDKINNDKKTDNG